MSSFGKIGSIKLYHSPIVTASFHAALPGTQPTPGAVNAFFYLEFSLNNDAAFRQFKIPNTFLSDPAVHVHWTKTSNVNELGKAVRWRVSYVIFPSYTTIAGDGSVTPSVIEVEDTYNDNGTTSRNVYSTPNVSLAGFIANYYLSIKIEAITPTGSALNSNPGLFSLDLTFNELNW